MPVTDTLPDTIAADTIAASAGKVSVPSIETLPETIAAETIAAPTKNPAHGRAWFDINQAAFDLAE